LQEEAEEKYRCKSLGMDGAYDQVECVLNYLAEKGIEKHWNIFFDKSAAGCSMTQSPNDNGMCHVLARAQFKAPAFRSLDTKEIPDPPGRKWEQLKMLLKQNMEPGSYKTYWKSLKVTQDFLSKAFSPGNVKSAWKKCGRQPTDVEKIMTMCPHYVELEREKRDIIINRCVPAITEIVEKNGFASESFNSEVLALVGVGVDNSPMRAGKQIDEMSPQRFRSTIMNHDSFRSMLASREEKENQEEEGKQQSKNRTKCDGCKNFKLSLCPKPSINLWIKCPTKHCRKWQCGNEDCKTTLQNHSLTCST
jgi:hypothetical protein